MSSLIGQRLGQYEIKALLGKGGMATVYLANQTSMGRDVAVKVIKPDLAEVSDFVARFEREAHTVASLSHPHILKVFDFGHDGELVYLVMELLRGGSLADQIRQGAFSPANTLRTLDQTASALDYAHEQEIIHRDLKPQNVLLDGKANALLTDFGIAKILSATVALTQSGAAMGTPSYMPPEQWQGLPLDSRADIYALGVMLFEMLTGRLPFEAETPFGMMHMHVYEQPPSISDMRADLPASIEQVINKAMAKNREDRFASAGDVAAAFRAALAKPGPTPTVQTASPTSAASRRRTMAATQMPTVQAPLSPAGPGKSNRSLFVALGVAVAAIIVIGGVLAVLSGRGTPTSFAAKSTSTDDKLAAFLAATMTAMSSTAITAPTIAATNVSVIVATTVPATAPTSVPTNIPTILIPATNTPAPTSTASPTAIPPTNTTAPSATPVPPTLAPTEVALAVAANGITLANASSVKALNVLRDHTDRVLSVTYNRDGTLIASGGGNDDPVIRLWDAKTGAQRAILKGHDYGVASLSFSPDGTLLASGSYDGSVRLWDVKSGQAGFVMGSSPDSILGVVFSPDGSVVAAAGQDGTVRLWNVKTGKQQAMLPGRTTGANGVAFSPNGSLLAVSGDDVDVRVWDLKTAKPKFTLYGHSKGTTSVTFSPDGLLLATGSEDKTVRLWDMKTGKTRLVLEGHDSAPASVAFSPDGSLLASGSWDTTIRLWDVNAGQQQAVLQGHTLEVYSIAFSPDGTRLASASVDKTIRIWGIN